MSLRWGGLLACVMFFQPFWVNSFMRLCRVTGFSRPSQQSAAPNLKGGDGILRSGKSTSGSNLALRRPLFVRSAVYLWAVMAPLRWGTMARQFLLVCNGE